MPKTISTWYLNERFVCHGINYNRFFDGYNQLKPNNGAKFFNQSKEDKLPLEKSNNMNYWIVEWNVNLFIRQKEMNNKTEHSRLRIDWLWPFQIQNILWRRWPTHSSNGHCRCVYMCRERCFVFAHFMRPFTILWEKFSLTEQRRIFIS